MLKGGARLFVENAILTKKCDERWSGIEVWGNSKVDFDGHTQSDIIHSVYNVSYPLYSDGPGVVIMNNSWIENAVIAVSTKRTDVGWQNARNYWGGLILANATTFSDNWKSAEFMHYQFINYSKFEKCFFMSPNLIGKTGISIWDCDNIKVSDCKFFDLSYSDDVGVKAIDAGFTITNDCEFRDYDHAIDVHGTGATFKSIIIDDNNKFKRNEVSFYVNSIPNGITVDLNDFEDSSTRMAAVGFVNGFTDYVITRNEFNSNDNFYHLFMRNTLLGRDKIVNNYFNNCFRAHILTTGDNQDLIFDQNCFLNSIWDVHQIGKISDEQGTPGKPFYNWFNASNTSSQIRTNLNSNKFNYYHPDISSSSNLVPVCDINSTNCPIQWNFENIPTVPIADGPSTCGGIMANRSLPVEPCLEFECLEDLKTEIVENKELIDANNTNGLISEINSSPNSVNTLDALFQASPFLSENVIAEVILSSTMTIQNKEDVLVENAPLSDTIMILAESVLDSSIYSSLKIIKDNINYSPRDSLYSLIIRLNRAKNGSIGNLSRKYWKFQNQDSIELILNNEDHYLRKRQLLAYYLDSGLWNKADSLFNLYKASYPQDSQFIVINTINLERLNPNLQSKYSLSSVDSVYLWNLALSETQESAEAQALLVLFQDTIFDAPIIDTLPESRYTSANEFLEDNLEYSEEKEFDIYPNPTKYSIIIEQKINCFCIKNISIYNLFGQLVKQKQFNSSKIILDMSNLPIGVYTIVINSNNSFYETHKIYVNR